MFIKYVFQNIGSYFTIWLVLTIINQVVFFGACLRPDCLLASIPHVSIISLIVLYISFDNVTKTYNENTGYNELGFDEDGYDRGGYNKNRYDRDGFDLEGYTSDNTDRNGTGHFWSHFTGREYKAKIKILNEKAVTDNRRFQKEKQSRRYLNKLVDKEETESQKFEVKEDRVTIQEARAYNNKEKSVSSFTKLMYTKNNLLDNYKQSFDKESEAENFRLFYENQPTNLIWYHGIIMYIPKEYFELKNLVNIDIENKVKCSLFPFEIQLIKELEEQKIDFLLEDNLAELFRRINMMGTVFSANIAIELIGECKINCVNLKK